VNFHRQGKNGHRLNSIKRRAKDFSSAVSARIRQECSPISRLSSAAFLNRAILLRSSALRARDSSTKDRDSSIKARHFFIKRESSANHGDRSEVRLSSWSEFESDESKFAMKAPGSSRFRCGASLRKTASQPRPNLAGACLANHRFPRRKNPLAERDALGPTPTQIPVR
jgi:hypothetical protein